MTVPQASEKFKRWFVDDALPLWAAQGYDHGRGGFYEALNFDGSPSENRPRRVRAQARQIHTFSQAGMRGWHKDAEALAAKGFEYFLEKACPEDGARGCVHLIGDNGEVIDDKRDLYDQAFLLLACASRWQAAKDDRALVLAGRTIEFLDRELASPYGGWHESDARELPRRQNPHMHLFEAFMALYAATKSESYLEYSRYVFELFQSSFLETDGDFIYEYFSEKLSPADDDLGKTIEPGHMMEWIWLIKKYEVLSQKPAPIDGLKIFQKAQKTGADPKSSFLVDRLVEGETPELKSRRLWPQTEYIKACIALAKNGAPQLANTASEIIENLFTTYLAADAKGTWIDQFDGLGAPMAKDVPASILYHLLEAVAETETLNASKGAQ
jgi:mannose-6-phosphate isomerase